MQYQFRGQHRNEEVLVVCRQHPFVLLHPFLLATGVFLLPLLVDVFLATGPVLSVSIVLCLVLGLVIGALAWHSWTNTVFLLTNERVVIVEQKGPLRRELAEIGLANIHQVSHEVKGLWGTMMGYGTISLYSGGAQQPLLVPHMPDPYELQQEIQAAVAGEGPE